MIGRKYFNKKKKCYFVFFILLVNIISIILLPNVSINTKNYENLNDDLDSRINLSNNPPNNNQFNYYKEIIIDRSKVSGLKNLNDFPFLISIYDSDLHEIVQSSGNDIAFSDGNIWLDHEIELFERDYNVTHAKLVVWVRLPSLSTTIDTKIYLYYGNATMSPRENPTGVWDTNYKGVWHSSEDPTGTIYDSTSNNNDGTPQGSMSSADQIDGQIDGSLNFDGNDEYVDCGNPTELQITGSITVEAWFKADYFGNTYLVSKNGPSGQRCWDISFDNINLTHGYLIYRYALNGDGHADDVGNVSIPINQWHHVVGVFNASTYSRLFLNGQKVDENTTNIIASQYDAPNAVRFGARGDIPPPNYFNGILDEVRISNIARSADWIKTEYDNQFDPSSFYSIGKEYSVSDHPSDAHYFLYYKEIVVDHRMVKGASDFLNFPVFISLLDSDLKNHVFSSSGNDVAFAYNAEWLDHELELFDQSFNGTHAQLVAWVRIPFLSTTRHTIIRMYYGNSTMGSRENPEGVWDSNYKAIWHLSESSGGIDAIMDSTSNENNGTDYGSPTFGSNGKLDGAIDFKGDIEDEYITMPTTASLNGITEGDYYTYEAWFYPDQVPPGVPADHNNHRYGIMIKKDPHHGLYYDRDQYFAIEHWLDIGGPSVRAVSSGTYSPGKYYHIVAIASNLDGYLKLYVNGNFEGETTWTGGTTPWDYGSVPLRIGIANPGAPIYRWPADGKIDEVRISDTARSEDWIKTEYKNQDDPSSFYSISKEYPLSGILPNNHYFKYYKEVTIDHNLVNGSQNLINFPLLISILDSELQDDVKQSNGNDIAFAYNGAWLDHEIELFDQTYNGTHAQLIAWVSIPRLFARENTNISMYYGNSTMSSHQNPSGVWSSSYKGVWHLSEDPSGLAPQMKDSTANNNDGTTYGSMTTGDQIEGQIDGSLNTDGINDYIATPFPGITGSAARTVSFWMSSSSLSDRDIFSYGDFGQNRFIIRIDESSSAGNWGMRLEMKDDTTLREQRWSTHITDGNLHYIVVVISENVDITQTLCYIDGQPDIVDTTYGSGIADSGSGGLYNVRMAFELNKLGFTGILDEVRISNLDHSADWIETEFNNQYNPQAFITLSPEFKFESIPPTYSNLIESSDPLELGDTEVIAIDVSDPSGINQVKIEFEGTNHSMNNTSGNTWQYYSWTPSSVDNYTYTIWMEDNYNNWNSTIGTIEVIDTTPPTYSDLIESADPLQIGQNETISIKVYDLSGVNQVQLEYNSSNHTMTFIGGNTWSWSKWNPLSLGSHSYTIYMQDMENNWNMTSGTIEVVSTTAPVIENLTKSADPLELGANITIFVDIIDNETFVSKVLIELESVNYTMNDPVGSTYNYTWTGSWAGTIIFTIYANDSLDNWNSLTGSFDIVDTTPPVLENLIESADPLELGNAIIISINSTDLSDISQLLIEFEGTNDTMTNVTGDIWQYDSWTPDATGNWSYTIWAEDNNNNWGSVSDSILVRDLTPPMYSDLTESSSIVELDSELTISINCTDLAEIKGVSIEYENANHTMTNIGGDRWQHNSWRPNSIGNYTYKIYITDNNDNLNYLQSTILFQDTILPIYSNLFESSDPLELGDNPIIRIDVHDYAGINQSLIEFEGANHSMINIYGNTWQYDLWTPTNWVVHQYRIHMEDMSGNWNLFITNITVQDTTPPPTPIFANSPSGDVSGILVFDWVDGYDHSGISYYILIIDNESNPLTTPGYISLFNITNVGPESSYYELSETLPLGRYYYFLAQIDGVGQQSSYSIGNFAVISIENGPPGNNLIFIIIIIGSVVGFATAIVIVRKRLKKDITPPRKKIPLKIISSHINKLSSSVFDGKQDQLLPSKELTREKEIETQINEIKLLGEELFDEGAYLEAQKQFRIGRDLLLNLGREEEAKLFSELIAGIEGLIEARENRLEILDQVKIEGNAEQIFEMHQDLIEISKKLRDPDGISYYQSELINYFQNNNLILPDLEKYRSELDHQAESLYRNSNFENAARFYEKCEKISQLLVQLEKEEEIPRIEEFRYKKNACMKKLNNE
ncbi:MAG: DUF2341 domain-containing protein [Promethearchaeota archaeon]